MYMYLLLQFRESASQDWQGLQLEENPLNSGHVAFQNPESDEEEMEYTDNDAYPTVQYSSGKPPRFEISSQSQGRGAVFETVDIRSFKPEQPSAFTSYPQRGYLNDHHLSIGSTVQLSDPPRYGVIRWIGELPAVQGLIAGVELVSK